MAEHANEKRTTDLPGLTGERVKAVVTILVRASSPLPTAGLSLAGFNPLPFTNEQVSATLFAVVGVIGTVYGWWKNQNITSASLAGQQLVDALKKEGVWSTGRQCREERGPERGGSRGQDHAEDCRRIGLNRRTRTTPWQTPTLCRAATSSDRRRLRKMARQSEPLSGP